MAIDLFFQNRRGFTSIYWTMFQNGSIMSYPHISLPCDHSDNTTVNHWTLLAVIDTLYLDESDSVDVVLDAGVTSGPTYPNDYSHFDLVTIDKIGNVVVSVTNSNQFYTDNYGLYLNYPNPFNTTTIRRRI